MFFSIPIPCAYTSLPLDGKAKNNQFFYLRGYARAHILVWIHFILPPYTREKNLLDNAGIEPGSPAPQASTLSIMPSRRASRIKGIHVLSQWKPLQRWFSVSTICLEIFACKCQAIGILMKKAFLDFGRFVAASASAPEF